MRGDDRRTTRSDAVRETINDGLTAPAFDPARDAWIVCRHADVTRALHDPRLTVATAPDGATPSAAPPAAHLDAQTAAHTAMRSATARALSPARMAVWRPSLAASAQAHVRSLPTDAPVDLVAAFAAPWAVEVAAMVTGVSVADAARLTGHARTVFAAAAAATDSAVSPAVAATAVDLARALQAAAPPPDGWPDVQAFVALSQTLPSLLAGAWHVLLDRPATLRDVRRSLRRGRRAGAMPTLPPAVVEELLRLAGPAHAVFRQATADVPLGATRVGAGERVILCLAAANRDPAAFPAPERLDDARSGATPQSTHLAFGAGRHRCPGAPVIRLALAVATAALLEGTDELALVEGATWSDGFAIRGPSALMVRLSRAPTAAP